MITNNLDPSFSFSILEPSVRKKRTLPSIVEKLKPILSILGKGSASSFSKEKKLFFLDAPYIILELFAVKDGKIADFRKKYSGNCLSYLWRYWSFPQLKSSLSFSDWIESLDIEYELEHLRDKVSKKPCYDFMFWFAQKTYESFQEEICKIKKEGRFKASFEPIANLVLPNIENKKENRHRVWSVLDYITPIPSKSISHYTYWRCDKYANRTREIPEDKIPRESLEWDCNYKAVNGLYVVTATGELRVHIQESIDRKNVEYFREGSLICHSSLAESGPVVAAGTFKWAYGEIKKITGNSGHYKPDVSIEVVSNFFSENKICVSENCSLKRRRF